MAPPNVPSSGGSIGERLTRKVGPLPVFVWAALILAAGYLFYRRSGGSSSQTTAGAPVSAGTSGSDTGAVSGSGGSGSPASNLTPDLIGQLYDVNASTIDSLTNAILSQSALAASDTAAGGPPGAVAQGPASAPTVNTSSGAATPPAVKVGGSAAHATQTAPGSLSWGGQTFTTKAAFDAWARAHGSTTARELSNHPQARQVYGTLK